MRIVHTQLWRSELRTRMPFKYGIATMTALPHLFVEVACEFDDLPAGGAPARGVSADHLPPKWFTKDPAKDPHVEIDEMLAVIRQAARHAADIRARTPFAWWRALYSAQDAWAQQHRVPPLLAHFGTSLLERAMIDAYVRAHRTTFAQALRENRFGFELGSLRPELAGTAPADWLPATPPSRVFARHTVGLLDPLIDADIAPADRADDGLPQSLAANLRAYQLRHFKLKAGGSAQDVDRLRQITRVIEEHAPAGWACTIDGNENFHSVAAFRTFWEGVRADPALEPLRRGLLFIEQPFHRDLALSDEIGALAAGWPDRPPIIIDESDASLSSLPRALALGYAGTSHKNCKGVFKGVANACLMARLQKTEPHRPWRMSGEDLSNIGPVALTEDLAVQASLGITSVERNGHHYFAGASAWPSALQEALLAHHPDLYTRSPRGWPTLRIDAGQISTQSVVRAPFGLDFAFDPSTSDARALSP